MKTLRKIESWFSSPWRVFVWPFVKMVRGIVPDEWYVRIQWRVKMGCRLDLEHPRTFNEKLQWLKLYNRQPEYSRMVDKVGAKEYAAEVIGREYIIPTLGVWERPEEIDFDRLPDRFVLKTSHGGGTKGVVICRDKSRFDRRRAVRSLARAMKRDIYRLYREWPYKNVHRCILAEQMLTVDAGVRDDLNAGGLADFKFFCFDGKADCVMVCLDRDTRNTRFYFFDRDWKLLRYNIRGIEAPEDFTLPRPAKISEMFDLAEKLSRGLPFARVDLYNVNGRIYFGEITLYPASGLDRNLLPETDAYFGSLIDLNSIQKR